MQPLSGIIQLATYEIDITIEWRSAFQWSRCWRCTATWRRRTTSWRSSRTAWSTCSTRPTPTGGCARWTARRASSRPTTSRRWRRRRRRRCRRRRPPPRPHPSHVSRPQTPRRSIGALGGASCFLLPTHPHPSPVSRRKHPAAPSGCWGELPVSYSQHTRTHLLWVDANTPLGRSLLPPPNTPRASKLPDLAGDLPMIFDIIMSIARSPDLEWKYPDLLKKQRTCTTPRWRSNKVADFVRWWSQVFRLLFYVSTCNLVF